MGNGIGIERVTQVALGTSFQTLWDGPGSPHRRQFDRRPRAQKTPYAERAKPRIRAETSGQRALRGTISRCVNRRVSRKNGRGERCVSVSFMARRWMSVRVELLGGRGEQLWPYPGRVFAVGPAHTFADLARAIDNAFARWDLSHLSLFTLADGRVVTDAETGADFATSAFGVVPTAALDIEVAKVMRTVEQGAQFRYVFDLGDDWTHCCTVGEGHIDPAEVLGVVPPAPMAYWGWGTIPDQYDRQWAEDDGEGRAPSRPRQAHAMLDGGWPGRGERPPLVDVDQLRVAAASGDVASIVAALEGHDVSEVLQRAGSAVQVALRAGPERVSSLAISLVQRLEMRSLPGDEELARDLLATVRRESPPGEPLPVDLEELSGLLEGDLVSNEGGFLDLRTGEVIPNFMTDEMMVGADAALDVDAEPDRWLRVPCEGSRAGWEDMATYVAGVADSHLREQLERAIEGNGAFRRFRDLIGDEGLTQAWQDFSDERQIGRARAYLAERGIRATS